MNDRIVLPGGLHGPYVRLRLQKHLRMLNQTEGHSTDLQCEKAVCEQLLKAGSVDISFAGEAHDMRRAFFAVKRMFG